MQIYELYLKETNKLRRDSVPENKYWAGRGNYYFDSFVPRSNEYDMKADVNTLTHMFWDCNRKYFGNSLPTPYIALFDKPNIVARFEYITIKVGTPLPDKPPGFLRRIFNL